MVPAPASPSATSARRDHQAERQPRPVATATTMSRTASTTPATARATPCEVSTQSQQDDAQRGRSR